MLEDRIIYIYIHIYIYIGLHIKKKMGAFNSIVLVLTKLYGATKQEAIWHIFLIMTVVVLKQNYTALQNRKLLCDTFL